jgi:glutathione synthase/RimK-type ligase-like ATP-grasp enzyme
MPHIAFLSMDDLSGFVSYDSLAVEILRSRGSDVEEVSWRAKSVDWNRYDLVVQRSSWDYQQAPDAYLQVLSEIERSGAHLQNSLSIAEWNIRKTYLRDLQNAGIAIVPTVWVSSPSVRELQQLFESLQTDELIIKPVVGANADDTFRLRPESPQSVWQAVDRAFAGEWRDASRNVTALVQPFVPSVATFGEVSLIFFLDQYSHSVLKTPRSGDFRVQEEHGGIIQSYKPSEALMAFAQRSLEAVPGTTLYARVDVVLCEATQPAIMEIELLEPSLYLSFDDRAPQRFAEAIEESL